MTPDRAVQLTAEIARWFLCATLKLEEPQPAFPKATLRELLEAGEMVELLRSKDPKFTQVTVHPRGIAAAYVFVSNVASPCSQPDPILRVGTEGLFKLQAVEGP